MKTDSAGTLRLSGPSRRRPVEIASHNATRRSAGDHDGMQEAQRMNTQQLSFRLPVELVERIDRHLEREQARHPAWNITRADVVRDLLVRAVELAEREAGDAPNS